MKNSETHYRQALRLAENVFGSESAETGMCLIELADCLERAGKVQEAEAVEDRYKVILCTLAKKLGLI